MGVGVPGREALLLLWNDVASAKRNDDLSMLLEAAVSNQQHDDARSRGLEHIVP